LAAMTSHVWVSDQGRTNGASRSRSIAAIFGVIAWWWTSMRPVADAVTPASQPIRIEARLKLVSRAGHERAVRGYPGAVLAKGAYCDREPYRSRRRPGGGQTPGQCVL